MRSLSSAAYKSHMPFALKANALRKGPWLTCLLGVDAEGR